MSVTLQECNKSELINKTYIITLSSQLKWEKVIDR